MSIQNEMRNMPKQKWVFYLALFGVMVMGGLYGGLNAYWLRHGFPAYGWIIDMAMAPVFLGLILYVRRLKIMHVDEFAVAKKRYAMQIGFMAGFVLFAVTSLYPILFKTQFHAFLNGMDGLDDAFVMGRVFGMAPFVIGLLIGQVVSWVRYR